MSDITVTFKNEAILTMDASGSKDLLTQGKYCEDDISISYVKPSGGGSVTITNIFSPATTYTAGYLSTSGTISNPSNNKEVVTDYIPVSSFSSETLYACIKTLVNTIPWAVVCFYDTDYNRIGARTTIVEFSTSLNVNYSLEHQAGNSYSYAAGSIAIPANASYIRLSFRTGGDAEMVFDQNSQAFESYWNHSASSMVFVNPFVSDGTAT